MTEQKKPVIDWEPAPGYVLCKPMKREELAALYNRTGTTTLSMPDTMGKVSDSVGVGEVVSCGGYDVDTLKVNVELAKAIGEEAALKIADEAKKTGYRNPFTYEIHDIVRPGDLIAFMPYTDKLIEIDGVKYSLVGYKQIMGVRKVAK